MKGLSHGAALAATSSISAAAAATSSTSAAAAATSTTSAAAAATQPPPGAPHVIAIIGGGFSGACLAIHLLRQTAAPTQVVIIDPQESPGPGLAYANRDYPYPLNVAAAQMSLDPSQPRDFLDFLHAQGIHAGATDYLPRQVFGDYVRARLQDAMHAARDGRQVSHRRGRVLQLRRGADGRWDLWLEDGSTQRADTVVLALGNPPPARLPEFGSIAGSHHYVDDPWSIGSCAHENIDSVLLVGSGLTMIDAALRLAAIRPRAHHIYVLSRHGLLPQPQATDSRPAVKPDLRPVLESST
jgi:uncharacterized NAD(P)/FAD-binding protein YdhS